MNGIVLFALRRRRIPVISPEARTSRRYSTNYPAVGYHAAERIAISPSCCGADLTTDRVFKNVARLAQAPALIVTSRRPAVARYQAAQTA